MLAKLFTSQKADAGGEGALIEIAESQELRGTYDVVDCVRILVVGDVVEASAQRPIKTEGVKSFFQMKV